MLMTLPTAQHGPRPGIVCGSSVLVRRQPLSLYLKQMYESGAPDTVHTGNTGVRQVDAIINQ